MPKYIIRLKDRKSYLECCKDLTTKHKPFQKLRHLQLVLLDIPLSESIRQWIEPELISELQEDIQIKLIQDRILTDVSPPIDEQSWGMNKIGASYVSIPRRYKRPRIAIFDTGISRHPSVHISKKYVNVSTEKTALDMNGHGTHVAGTIGGFRKQKGKVTFHGIYPQLPITSVKSFAADGTASLSAILKGIEWCIKGKIRLLVLNFGVNRDQPLLRDAVKTAHRKGILMMAPSGNNGTPFVSYPARYPEIISVGSINKQGEVSSFSQYGNNLDLVAPGEEIVSTWSDAQYQVLSGTSMACAHVAGAAALIFAVKPHLSVTEARHFLLSATDRLPASLAKQGNGLLSLKKIQERLK